MIQWDDIKDTVAEGHKTSLTRLFEAGGFNAQILGASVAGDVDYARQLVGQDATLASIPTGEVTPLRLAAYYGHRAVAELLIEYGAPLDQAASDSKDFPLHLAAAQGHADVVALLLEEGAHVDSRAHHERTPLLEAAKHNRVDVIRLLVRAGADLEARGGDVWRMVGPPFRRRSISTQTRLKNSCGLARTSTPSQLRDHPCRFRLWTRIPDL